MSQIGRAFADGPAFIPYLAAGDPEFEASHRLIDAVVDAGADILELGLPFSDPVADGAAIREATVRALSAGMTPQRYLSFAAELDVSIPVVTMSYYNPIYQYGDEQGPRPFVRDAAAAGIDGVIVPDLPAEEADPLRAACDEFDLDLIFIVAPTTGADRLQRIRQLNSGYVYVQARLGTTGARTDISDQTVTSLNRVADWELPKAVGFGISTPEQATQIVNAGADGIIIGSALIDRITAGLEQDASIETIATELRTYAGTLAAGTHVESEGPLPQE